MRPGKIDVAGYSVKHHLGGVAFRTQGGWVEGSIRVRAQAKKKGRSQKGMWVLRGSVFCFWLGGGAACLYTMAAVTHFNSASVIKCFLFIEVGLLEMETLILPQRGEGYFIPLQWE